MPARQDSQQQHAWVSEPVVHAAFLPPLPLDTPRRRRARDGAHPLLMSMGCRGSNLALRAALWTRTPAPARYRVFFSVCVAGSCCLEHFCVVWRTVCQCGAVLNNCSLLNFDARASLVPALTHWLTRVTYARTWKWQLEGNDAQPWYCPICRSKCCCAKSECTVTPLALCGCKTYGSDTYCSRRLRVHKMPSCA